KEKPAVGAANHVLPFGDLVFWLVAVVGGTGVLIVALTWWFRRSDRRVRLRVAEAQAQGFVAPGEPGPETHRPDEAITADPPRGEGPPPTDRGVWKNGS